MSRVPAAPSGGPVLPTGFSHLTVSSGLRAAAARTPNKTAMVLGNETRSYAHMVERVNRHANVAAFHFDLMHGDCAAIVSPNSMLYLELVVALSDIGAAMATPNPKLTAYELADICNDANAQILYVHPDCRDRIDASLLMTVVQIVWLDASYEELLQKASDRIRLANILEWSTFSIPYTSGTTGKPKGVMLSHRSRSLQFLAYGGEYGCYSPDDYFLAISPMCHGAGFAYAFGALFVGGTVEIMTKFEPEAVLRAIHHGRVTGLFTVPTHYHGIFGLEAKLLDGLRGNRLNGIIANAAPLSQDAKERIVDYFGEGLLSETYGSTEAGIVSNLRPVDQLRKSRCVGLPAMGNRVRLLDEAGHEVAAGEVGELHSASTFFFNGYVGRPEETAQTMRDGWLSVGDLARKDEEGYLYIVDRKKDMVITGGMNVYPREVENVLDTHPTVFESAVIGVPDARWGEKLIAFVVVNAAATFDADLVTAFLSARLAPYKLPKSFLPIDVLPRNATGKVLKPSLREHFASLSS